MAIGFSGIGAGADWNSIINQLLQIESRPLENLRSREKELDRKISEFGRVKSLVDTFRSAIEDLRSDTGFALFKQTSSDESVLTIETNSSAVASSYDVVVTQLASRDKLASSAYVDSSTAVGTGTLSITVNGASLDLTVDASNNTLAGLRDAINSATDNPGVAATILNETGGSRLILTSKETGAVNAIEIGVTDVSGLSRLFQIGAGDDGLAEQVAVASDGLLTVDGFDIVSASNSVTGAISGVTLQLASVGSAAIDIERDNAQVEEKISQFVDAYNTLLDELKGFETTSLGRDSGLRQMVQGFVGILNQPANIDGIGAHLFEAGITRDRFGRISLDAADLADALANDFQKVSQLFSDDATGYATRFYDYADQLLELDGIIASREEGLGSRKRTLQNQIDRQEIHLEIVEKSLIDQFMALDKTMAALQSTSNYLTGQLSSLLS